MCTTMIITKGAAKNEATMVTHSCDDELADQRTIYVPAQDHPAETTRDILPKSPIYPRLVSNNRGPGYKSSEFPITHPIGEIPQVAHTYAYFDGNYGIMNEHNLMIGECTNGAKFVPDYVTQEKSEETGEHIRFFYSDELSRIALERCRTAREAVELMGRLIDEYGFYATGETLLVGDSEEGWVFEICALPDSTYHSAWVAQRVPDGEVFVAANEYRIRIIDETREDQLHSPLLFEGAKKLGWWSEDEGPLDWLKTVSYGEYRHPYYSLRRIWRVFDRVNPDAGLSPWVEDGFTTYYPFSIKPRNKLTLESVKSLYRDHYEGTEFDLTQGIAAGPFGDPHRFFGHYDTSTLNITTQTEYYGAWERPISVFYQGYVYINEARNSAPELTSGIMWLAPDVAFTSCFIPFPTGISQLPDSFQTGCPTKYDRESAWWVFDLVGNWSRLNFQRMTTVDILPLQSELEEKSMQLVSEWDSLVKFSRTNEIETQLTRACHNNASEILDKWRELSDVLIAKYANGYLNLSGKPPLDIGYPTSWLPHTDYAQGPTSYRFKLDEGKRKPF